VARLAPAELVVHWPVPQALAIAGAHEVTLVSHGADVRILRAMPAPLRARVVRRLVTRATTWRFVSRGLAGELLTALADAEAALVAAKLCVEPCPIEMPEIDTTKAQRALDALRGTDTSTRPLYVSLGRLIPLKRVERAVRYAKHHDADLLIIGDGPERARLETYARQVGARASFCGALPRGDALGLLSRADALLMTSASEGLPTVVREAEALGTPVRWVGVG
jgi:glycosyltransferase involved in cell wall biosynthesis